MARYKDRPDSFNSGGKKERLHRVLTLIGNADTLDGVKPKKKTPEGYQ